MLARLGIVQALATGATKYTRSQLEDIADQFGDDFPMSCTLPIGLLVRACEELDHHSLQDLRRAAATMAG